MKPPPPQPEEPCSSLAERQAIMEYDGCMPRDVAERRARFWTEWYEEQTRKGQRDLF